MPVKKICNAYLAFELYKIMICGIHQNYNLLLSYDAIASSTSDSENEPDGSRNQMTYEKAKAMASRNIRISQLFIGRIFPTNSMGIHG
uniref:Uncharacterized protein n=1 Tax=Romanomermis culicivorax TaxID=13658 RepID=A0A915K5Y0_ROMCU